MSAAYWKILFEQGTTWRTSLTLREVNTDGTPGDVIDLTGYTARMQARVNVDSPDTLLSIGTGTGEVTIDGPAGRITIVIAAAVSSAWTWRYGVHQLELIAANGEVIRLATGEIELDREVVR